MEFISAPIRGLFNLTIHINKQLSFRKGVMFPSPLGGLFNLTIGAKTVYEGELE